MGRLERHLDEDLIDRMAAGWTIDLYDSAGVAEGRCLFSLVADRLDCPRLPRR